MSRKPLFTIKQTIEVVPEEEFDYNGAMALLAKLIADAYAKKHPGLLSRAPVKAPFDGRVTEGQQSGDTTDGGGIFLSAIEAARALKISTRTLHTLTHRGEVPFKRIGARVLYPRRALEAWANRTEAPNL